MKIYREAKEIDEQIRNLGYRKLPKPIQQGWTMQLTLRDDYKKRKDHKYWEELLEIVETSEYSANRNFMRRTYLSKKKKKVILTPRSLREGYYEEILEEKYKKHFEKRLVSSYNWGSYFRPSFEYVLVQGFMFVSEIIPRMVDKVKITDSVLESKSKRLWNTIETNNYMHIIDKYLGWHYKDDWNYESKEITNRHEKQRFFNLVREERYDEI